MILSTVVVLFVIMYFYEYTIEIFNKICLNILDTSERKADVRYTVIIEDAWNKSCQPLSEYCSLEWLLIPEYPISFRLFQFVYFTNRSIDEFKVNIKSDLICFNKQRCSMLLSKIVSIKIINGLTCFHSSNLINDIQMKNFNDLNSFFRIFNDICLKTSIDKSCSNSSYFYCNISMKCISYHRVGDERDDCYFGEDTLFNACQSNDSQRYQCQENFEKCSSQVAAGDELYECFLGGDELLIYIYTQ